MVATKIIKIKICYNSNITTGSNWRVLPRKFQNACNTNIYNQNGDPCSKCFETIKSLLGYKYMPWIQVGGDGHRNGTTTRKPKHQHTSHYINSTSARNVWPELQFISSNQLGFKLNKFSFSEYVMHKLWQYSNCFSVTHVVDWVCITISNRLKFILSMANLINSKTQATRAQILVLI